VQASNVFQDNFNSATTFANQWNVSTVGNGGTATVQNGKLIITNVGGSDGYMGKGDGINLIPKNIFTTQSNNVSFSISTKEISRLRTNGYKDNSGVGLGLKPSSSSNDNISIGIYGNYSGYHPDPAKPGWTYYNTYNGHSIRISSSVNGTYYLHDINELDLNTLYDFDFKLEQVSGSWFARYKRSSSTTWTSVQIPAEKSPAFASEFVPSIGVWSGDGGYTRQNGSVNVEIDNALFTEQKTIKKGVSSNTDICPTHLDWCANPTFDGGLGMISNSDIPINLINTSYIVDSFTRKESNGKATITANLYNRGYADAMLDVYDRQGNWTGFISLNGNRPETTIIGDIWDKWTTTYDSYFDEYSVFDPRDSAGVEKLAVTFSIPRGGYAVLSKNSSTALANTILNTALAIFDEPEWIKPKGNAKVKLLAIFANEAINEGLATLIGKLTDAVNRNDQEQAETLNKELTKKLFSITYNVFVNNSDLAIKIIGDNKTKRFAKKVKKYFSPVSGLIESAEVIATGLSVTGQWIDISKSNNGRAVYFK